MVYEISTTIVGALSAADWFSRMLSMSCAPECRLTPNGVHAVSPAACRFTLRSLRPEPFTWYIPGGCDRPRCRPGSVGGHVALSVRPSRRATRHTGRGLDPHAAQQTLS